METTYSQETEGLVASADPPPETDDGNPPSDGGMKSAATETVYIFPLNFSWQADGGSRGKELRPTEPCSPGEKTAQGVPPVQTLVEALALERAKAHKPSSPPKSTQGVPPVRTLAEVVAGPDGHQPALLSPLPVSAPQRQHGTVAPPKPDRAASNKKFDIVLRRVNKHWRSKSVNEMHHYYAIGVEVRKLEDTSTYGAKAKEKLGRKAGIPRSTVYRCAMVAGCWTAKGFQKLCGERDKNGRALTWSHCVAFASIKDPQKRADAIAATLKDGLSVNELEKHLDDGAGAKNDAAAAKDGAASPKEELVRADRAGAGESNAVAGKSLELNETPPPAPQAAGRPARVIRAVKVARDLHASIVSFSANGVPLRTAYQDIRAAELHAADRDCIAETITALEDMDELRKEMLNQLTAALQNNRVALPVVAAS